MEVNVLTFKKVYHFKPEKAHHLRCKPRKAMVRTYADKIAEMERMTQLMHVLEGTRAFRSNRILSRIIDYAGADNRTSSALVS